MAVDQNTLDQVIAGLTKPAVKPAAAVKPWCRAKCGEKLNPILVNREDGSGLHLLCDEPPAPAVAELDLFTATAAEVNPIVEPTGPPPSTVAELRDILIAYDAARPRTMQVRLGPSELGTPCQQQIARKLAGAPRRPVDTPTWAPFQGTAVHAEMENVVAFWNEQLGRTRWLAEDDLEVDPGLEGVEAVRGHGDAFDIDHSMVVDWKHVGTTALAKLRSAKRMGKPPAEQVSAEYRVQAHLYGLGHERKGRDVRHVRLVLLARSWQYDDSDEWTEAYDPQIAYQAIARYYATHDLINTLNVAASPDFIAAIPATPSADACKWCPFHRPGQPGNWGGCAGDTSAHERRVERFADGLILPAVGIDKESR